MEINKIIERRIKYQTLDNKRIWISTKSFQPYGLEWSNCLYIEFIKEDFPQLKYPCLNDCDYSSSGKIFDYFNCSLASLDWHGGITFYEECFNNEMRKTVVRAGCDYQHLWDEAYRSRDYGDEIIQSDGICIMDEFLKLVGIEKDKNDVTI